ncbi:MAG: hypothetical protein JSS34_07595 [Proteobacteria bacterium]|nr:hypothetical protein [Pseudomonadota bacterium]
MERFLLQRTYGVNHPSCFWAAGAKKQFKKEDEPAANKNSKTLVALPFCQLISPPHFKIFLEEFSKMTKIHLKQVLSSEPFLSA